MAPQQSHISPCAAVIDRAQQINEANMHENDGFLSYKSGFMPLSSPLTHLPQRFEAWDRLAASLPEMLRDQTLRARVDQLAVLSADAQSLPDKYLQRASTILSILTHIYVHADMAGPVKLPECLSKPWNEVTKRLGREKPSLSYIDLIVYNWKKNSNTDGDFCLENLALLVPTVGINEERVFYLTQAEILSRATPLLNAVVDAQVAVQSDDVDALKAALQQMTATLGEIGRKSLTKITPNPTRKSYVDPVVWAKSVAPVAVPLQPDVPGPGGTASPLFHLMDNFIGRTSYSTLLGEEAQRIRKDYPRHWRDVISAAGEVDVAAFIGKKDAFELTQMWQMMKERYRGPMGLLGLHRRKVFAYLPMAFKVGRSATIAGFKGDVSQAEWIRVHDELEKSRKERYTEGNTSKEIATTPHPRKTADQSYPVSALVEHSGKDIGYWFAAKGRVYEVTKYLRMHPGGDKILINSSGRDVTTDLFAVSHFQEPAISEKLERYVIGDLDIHAFSSKALRKLYDFSVAMAYKVTDLHNTIGINTTFLQSKLTAAESPGQLTEQKRRFVAVAQELLGEQFIPSIASHVEAIATLCDSPTESRFKALQRRSASVASIEEGYQTLGLCQAQAVSLLRTLESVPTSAAALSERQIGAVERCLERLAELLEMLGPRVSRDTSLS